MTGFGAAEGAVGGGSLRVEIKSVNHRYFNLTLKAPPEVAALETEIRERLRREFERGHIALTARWSEPPAARAGPSRISLVRAEQAMARLRELKAAFALDGEIDLDLVSRQPEVFAVDEATPDGLDWAGLEPIVGAAAAQCRAMRRREGNELVRELVGRLGSLRALAGQIAARAPERLIRERDRLRASVATLLEGRKVDEERLELELAVLADKLDITEELVRLDAHLDACLELLGAEKAAGKQLGFLAQEIGREINTIGSKANDASIQHGVVEMKGDLERFKEQLENVE